MFLGRYALEGNIVFLKSNFEILGAFVVKNVKIWCMTLKEKFFVGGFPGISNAGSLVIGNGFSVDGIGVMMVEDKDIAVASA